MSSNRCRAREDECETYLRDHGPSSLSAIAAALGVKPATASNYMQCLRKDGRAWNTGMGCKAIWHLGATPEDGANNAVLRAIKQAASVWEYAQRCAD